MSDKASDPVARVDNAESGQVENNEQRSAGKVEVSDEVEESSDPTLKNEASSEEDDAKVRIRAGFVMIKELEDFLKNIIDSRLLLMDYETSLLLPPGEIYDSTILKVDANIKMTEDSPEEKLHLVAKMLPATEFQKNLLKTSLVFKKEMYFFEKLTPALREIEAESLDTENLIELFPKFYGGRVGEEGSDAIILLENLKVRGYETVDVKKGLDLEHAKLAVGELARLHGLGMSLRYHNSAVFEEARKHMSELSFQRPKENFQTLKDRTIELLLRDPRIANHEERIREAITRAVDCKSLAAAEPAEPWIGVAHGDFWVNNIMFRHGENGKLDGVKFVDFQLAGIFSPLCDLAYFLCTSTSPKVLKDQLDELLSVYYERFSDTLRKTGCDDSPFTRESFDEELAKQAQTGYLRCVLLIKLFTSDVPEAGDVDKDDMSSVVLAERSKLYFDRVWDITSKSLEKGWL